MLLFLVSEDETGKKPDALRRHFRFGARKTLALGLVQRPSGALTTRRTVVGDFALGTPVERMLNGKKKEKAKINKTRETIFDEKHSKN